MPVPKRAEKHRIFVSHASADRPVADRLFKLLQTGCNIDGTCIFCTSVESAGPKVGEKFVERIRTEVADATVVIALISPNYRASVFCTAEIGAAWVLKKPVFPLVLPGLARDPGSVLLGTQSEELGARGLDNLRDALGQWFGSAKEHTGRWSVRRDEFLKDLAEVLEALPEPDLVPIHALKEAEDRAGEHRAMYERAHAEMKRLERVLENVEKLKNAEEVRTVRLGELPERKAFDTLVAQVQKDSEELSPVEVRCLYDWYRMESWRPSREDYEGYREVIDRAIEEGSIEEIEGAEGGYALVDSHPKFKRVRKSLDAVADFLEKRMSGELAALLEAELECPVDMTNHIFWRTLLVRGLL